MRTTITDSDVQDLLDSGDFDNPEDAYEFLVDERDAYLESVAEDLAAGF